MMAAFLFLTFFALVIFRAANGDGGIFRPDYMYNPQARGWFKLHTIPANWEDARLRCFFEGAILASPLNKDIVNGMKSVISADRFPIFTGIHSNESPGDYKSIEGVPLSEIPAKWLLGEPDNMNNQESCLVYHANDEMADVNCANVHPYICYKKETQDLSVTECGTVDEGYKVDRRTGRCYKFHREGLQWARAMMACSAEGAHLAIINSDTEAEVIKDLFTQNPTDTITGLHTDGAFIGFYEWPESGLWGTIHGQTIQQSGYARWADNQPDNIESGTQRCGVVFRKGLLDNENCNVNMAFICEKDSMSLGDLSFDVRGSSGNAEFRSDYTHVPEAEGWFKAHELPANWEDARHRCFFEGGVLASPLNNAIEAAITQIMPSHLFPIFTGIQSKISPGDYFSVEGVPLSDIPAKWLLGEPDNKNNQENCLAFYGNGEMADVSCNRVFPYICYKKETRGMKVTECGTIDKEYQLDNRTGSCYKFHRIGLPWSRALMACAAEGGYLAIINSDAEAEVIRNLFRQNPEDCLSAQYKVGARIGFYDWGNSGHYGTIHGQTLEEAGYAKWGEGQPDVRLENVERNEVWQHCGGVFRDGLLDNVFCHSNMAFICEKDPNSLREPTFDVRAGV